jgi:hypothetical protein
MTKKLKHIISITLVFIFLTPMTVKLLDTQYHDHDHFVCTAKNELHFHEHHYKCPILAYEFSLYSINKIKVVTYKTHYFEKLLISYFSIYCCSKSKFSFLLRAPPLNIHI